MPLLYAKKEVFEWLKSGQKTIDIRRGLSHQGEFAVFQSGSKTLKMRIVKCEQGRLTELVHEGNFRLVIPTAKTVGEALNYLHELFGDYDGVFTAYHLVSAAY